MTSIFPKTALILAAASFIAVGAYAMKPAPFETVRYVDPKSKIRLVSVPENLQADSQSKPATEVIDSKGKVLWTMDDFVGRTQIKLSPDGKFLALLGNHYFPHLLNLSKEGVVARVFEKGKEIRKVQLSDVVEGDPDKSASERKLAVKGGGWVEREQLLKSMSVDWTHRKLKITSFDNRAHEIGF
jgi:hypothetical protein